MKIVLDTNVIISGLIFKGSYPHRLLQAVLNGKIQNVTSPDILQELRRVLANKFQRNKDEHEALLHLIADASEIVYPIERIDWIATDPSDNRILECAAAVPVDAIVTGDKKHLLPLKKFRRIPILSPSQIASLSGIF